MTDVPQEWVEKAAQALVRDAEREEWGGWVVHSDIERIARAVLAAVLPDVRRAVLNERVSEMEEDARKAHEVINNLKDRLAQYRLHALASDADVRRAVAEEIAAAIEADLFTVEMAERIGMDYASAANNGKVRSAFIARSLASPTDRDG